MKSVRVLVALVVLAAGAVLYLLGSEPAAPRDGARTARDAGAGERAGEARETDGDAFGDERGTPGDEAGTRGRDATVTVLRPDGGPAAGARVEVHGPRAASAATDTVGRAALRGLVPGAYSAVATAEGLTGSARLRVGPGGGGTATVELVRAVAIEGRVFAGGAPLTGAVVEAVRSPARRGLDMTRVVRAMSAPEERAAHAVAGGDGAYQLLVGAGGRYMLRVSARGFARQHEAPRVYTVPVDGIDFRLFPGTRVAGRVVDRRERPLAGAQVLWIPGFAGIAGRAPKAEAYTDAAGRFSFTVAPVERMMLVAGKPGFAPRMVQLELPADALEIVLGPGFELRARLVDEGTGAPADGVSVSAVYRGSFTTATSGADGRVVVRHLPAPGDAAAGGATSGARHLYAWGAGFVPKLVRLRDREPERGVLDLGDVPLARGGVVRGRVLDADTDKPVEGARVRTLGGVPAQLAMLELWTARSGPDGTYELTGVPRGAARVVARHADYAFPHSTRDLLAAARGNGEPLLAPGERVAEHDVRLRPSAGVTGTVLGPGDDPVAGARVEALPGSELDNLLGTAPPPAFTGPDGAFTLGGLARGDAVRLEATHRAFGTSEVAKAQAGGDAHVVLRLAEPIRVAGVVQDEAGEPVAGARVEVRRSKDPAARPAVTDRSGTFTLHNVPADDLELLVEHDAHVPLERPLRVTGARPDLTLDPIRLARGPHIAGIVAGEDGEPRAGVRVHGRLAHPGTADDASGRTFQGVQTDEQGRFLLAGLRPGAYRVSVRGPGLWAEPQVVETSRTGLRLRAVRAGRIEGVVTAAGRPVPGADIAVLKRRPGELPEGADRTANRVGWTRADERGRFSVERVPPGAPLVVRVRHDAFVTGWFEGVVPDGTERTFALRRGVRVAGTVVGADGAPVAFATVSVFADGRLDRHVRTDAAGAWSAGGLAPGALEVRADARHLGFVRGDRVAVVAGDERVRLRLAKGAAIAGRVEGAGGDGASVRVEAVDQDGDVAGAAVAAAPAYRFRIGALPPGRYAVRAKRDGHVVGAVDDVAAGTEEVVVRAG